MSDLNVRNRTPVGVISWNNGESARAISQALSNGKLLKKDSSALPPSVRTIINFGCSAIQRGNQSGVRVLNNPEAVVLASSKIRTLERIRYSFPNSVPSFWTDPNEAVFYAVQNNFDLVCRTIDNGHSGSGIVLVTQEELQAQGNVPRASVYVQAIKKRREYRVHVGMGENSTTVVIDIARKVRRSGVPDGGVNGEDRPFIWNHGNDFIFQRTGLENDITLRRVASAARNAVRALGLTFGAVDVVVEAGVPLEDAKAYVLEVNTAPGMEGTTLARYIEFFNHKINGAAFTPYNINLGEEYEDGSAE